MQLYRFLYVFIISCTDWMYWISATMRINNILDLIHANKRTIISANLQDRGASFNYRERNHEKGEFVESARGWTKSANAEVVRVGGKSWDLPTNHKPYAAGHRLLLFSSYFFSLASRKMHANASHRHRECTRGKSVRSTGAKNNQDTKQIKTSWRVMRITNNFVADIQL